MKETRSNFSLANVFVFAAILLPLFAALASTPAKDDPSLSASLPKGPAVNSSYMDRTVRPGDDFYEYACGEWMKHTEIPADRGGTFPGMPLVDETDKRVADLITEVGKSAAPGDEARKIADLYNSYMNEAGIEAKGIKPLQPHL